MINPDAYVRFKDMPNIQSMFGNIGNSWNNPLPNDLFIKGVPKNILSAVNTQGTVGTGLDILRTFTFPARSLNVNGACFHAALGGFFGGNDDDKRVRLTLGGVQLYDTAIVLDFDGNAFFLDTYVTRISPTEINFFVAGQLGNTRIDSANAIASSGMQVLVSSGNLTVINNMDTLSNDLVLLGESATVTNNNVVHHVANIELTRF